MLYILLCLWVQMRGINVIPGSNSCDPGRVLDGLRLAIYQALFRERSSWFCARLSSVCTMHSLYFTRSLRVSDSYCRFCLLPSWFLFFTLSSLELCKCSSDFFLSGRPRTVPGLATTYITGYVYIYKGPIDECEEHTHRHTQTKYHRCPFGRVNASGIE